MSEEDVPAVPGRFDESMSVKGATTKATRERQRRIRLNDRCRSREAESPKDCHVYSI